jgi:hypothetical protein
LARGEGEKAPTPVAEKGERVGMNAFAPHARAARSNTRVSMSKTGGPLPCIDTVPALSS